MPTLQDGGRAAISTPDGTYAEPPTPNMAYLLHASQRSPNDNAPAVAYVGAHGFSDSQGTRARFPFDQIYKALCCHRETVADMLGNYLAEPEGPLAGRLVDALDLGSLRKLSSEWVTREFRIRRGDQVWQVGFKEAAQGRGYPPFMMNLEFQSRGDRDMALRFHAQGGELLREIRAQGAVRDGQPCPVLCVLVHNGPVRWTAATSVADLVSLPPALGPTPNVPRGLRAFYPWGYHSLDFVQHRARGHIPGSIVSMMIGIEFARRRRDLVAPLWETVRNIEDEGLRDTVARWLRRLNDRYNLDLPGMEELLAMEDVTVLSSRLDETIEGWRRGAVSEGQRELLRRQTAQRFGTAAAERLAVLLRDTDDSERIALVGEWFVDAETETELFERIAALLRM